MAHLAGHARFDYISCDRGESNRLARTDNNGSSAASPDTFDIDDHTGNMIPTIQSFHLLLALQ